MSYIVQTRTIAANIGRMVSVSKEETKNFRRSGICRLKKRGNGNRNMMKSSKIQPELIANII